MAQVDSNTLDKNEGMQKQGYSVRLHPEEFLHRYEWPRVFV